MGNTESNVTSGVKKQADTSSIQMYKLVDLKGGGLLVELMKRAAQNKQYAELDHAIKTKVEPFLYNKGKGKLIPIPQLVLMRNMERPRHKMLPVARNLEEPFDIDKNYLNIPEPKEGEEIGDVSLFTVEVDKEIHLPRGLLVLIKYISIKCYYMSKYREVCWNLKERGAVGETILHLCLLSASSLHADLAKRLLRFYPKLINDVYMGDEYYGESVLHIAIVNEDPAMVKFLLDNGVNVQERCFGNFMCAEDQKASRTDSLDYEACNLSPITNYEGYVYWGEYPLSFAACLSQEECYRLMLARGANPDSQDSNGNTVLHMLVIYKKVGTFDMAYEMGADLSFRNNQHLTPLTLSAKLARVEMFFHILNIEREIYWQIGSITCAAYPLAQIDTIDIKTGNISKDSALNLVVFGDKDEHLELMDGVLVDLLNAKWNAFVKFRFYRQFIFFTCYFLISMVCFTLRPGPSNIIKTAVINSTIANTMQTVPTNYNTTSVKFQILKSDNVTDSIDISTEQEIILATSEPAQQTLVNINKHSENDIIERERAQNLIYNNSGSYNLNHLISLQYKKDEINISLISVFKSLNNDIFIKNIENKTKKVLRDNLNNDHNIMYTNHERKSTPKFLNQSKFSYSSAIGSSKENAIPMVNITRIYLTLPTKATEMLRARIDLKKLWHDLAGECRLMETDSTTAIIRLCAELAMEIGAVLYIVAALREARFLGLHMFIENLMTAPSRVMFLFSCLLMLIMPTLRFKCNEQMEDIVVVVIMLTTTPYFLFFCRGFKTVGPFVVMIYRMVMGDLLRFGTIYLVFVMGFSQAYYIIFLSFDNPLTPDGVDDSISNPVPNPIEAVMAMFFMSLTNFGDYYAAFDRTEHQAEAKLLFVLYMGIVAILLVNMLIAMMGNTYQKIAETRNEWQRQWARIVLVVERGVSPSERLTKLMWYSQPMSDGRRALVLRLNQTEEDKEEMKEILEMKRVHLRMVQKRKSGKKVTVQTPSPQRLVDLSTTV